MRRVLRIINEISLGWLLAGLFGTILGFAIVYWLLALTGAGLLEFTYAADHDIGFADTLYFSLVTISSLGYGDIRPIGWSRMITGAEVVVGLAFFGLLVAKISSVKQDYLLRRLYSDLVDEKLAKYTSSIEESGKLYRITSNLLLNGDIDPELTTTFRSEVTESTFFYQVYQQLKEVRDLIVAEEYHGGFFGDVSDVTLGHVYAATQGMLSHTMRLLERDPERACRHVLCGNERWISRFNQLADEIACLGKRGSRNPEIVTQCMELMDLSRRVREMGLPAIQTARERLDEEVLACPFDAGALHP